MLSRQIKTVGKQILLSGGRRMSASARRPVFSVRNRDAPRATGGNARSRDAHKVFGASDDWPQSKYYDDRADPLPFERLLLKTFSVRDAPVSLVRQSERSAGAAKRGPQGRLAPPMTVPPQT